MAVWMSASDRPEERLMVVEVFWPVSRSAADTLHDAVGVDLEGHLDLHLAAVADAEAGELELAQHLALVGPVRLALVDADLHLLLAVAAGGEGLRLVDGDRGVLVDDLLGVAAHRADAQRQRRDVHQEGLGARAVQQRVGLERRAHAPPPGPG